MAVEEQLGRVMQRLEDEASDREPWVTEYVTGFVRAQAPQQVLRGYLRLLQLADRSPQDADIFDAGCGLGLGLVTYGLHGARRLRGVEGMRELVSLVPAYRCLLPDGLDLEVAHGDVRQTPYADASFDIVICVEAISHFLDVEAFLREAARILRPGGTLLISDGNNRRHRATREHNLDLWEAAETGADHGIEHSAHQHLMDEPYERKRERIVREEAPSLTQPQARALAEATAGMTRAGVLEATRTYQASATMPHSHYRRGQVPVEPFSGQVNERMFDPFELAGKVEAHGFAAKAYGYWGGGSGNPFLRAANRIVAALSPLTIRTSREFRIIATRRQS